LFSIYTVFDVNDTKTIELFSIVLVQFRSGGLPELLAQFLI